MKKIGNGVFYNGDCVDILGQIPDASIDMVLVDLPYGTTQNKWDSIIPLDQLWQHYSRVCKPNSAMVFTAVQPFTSMLITSNLQGFKYQWYWEKPLPTGFANAKKQPLRDVEDICVFYRSQCTYNPQGLRRCDIKMYSSKNKPGGDNYGGFTPGKQRTQELTNYPRQLLRFSRDPGSIHPTQKPIALWEYLIRTYTNPGDVVLDNTAGSGTTAVAAEHTGRRWICIERDPDYYQTAVARVESAINNDLFLSLCADERQEVCV